MHIFNYRCFFCEVNYFQAFLRKMEKCIDVLRGIWNLRKFISWQTVILAKCFSLEYTEKFVYLLLNNDVGTIHLVVRKSFRKTNISYPPDTHTFRGFAYVLNE